MESIYYHVPRVDNHPPHMLLKGREGIIDFKDNHYPSFEKNNFIVVADGCDDTHGSLSASFIIVLSSSINSKSRLWDVTRELNSDIARRFGISLSFVSRRYMILRYEEAVMQAQYKIIINGVRNHQILKEDYSAKVDYTLVNKKFLDSHIQSRSFLQIKSPISVLPAGTNVVIIGYKNYPSSPTENNQVTLLLRVNHNQIGGSWIYSKGVTTTGMTVPKEFDGEYCYWIDINVGEEDISEYFFETGEFYKEIEESPKKTSDDKPIPVPSRFLVGDVIIGNSNEYGVTGKGQICIVSKIIDLESIQVYLVTFGGKISNSAFNVLSERFDLYRGEKESLHYSQGINEQSHITSHINAYFEGGERIRVFERYSERVSKKYDEEHPSKNTLSIKRKTYDVVSTDSFSSETKTSEHYIPPSKDKSSKILLPLIEVKKRPTY